MPKLFNLFIWNLIMGFCNVCAVVLEMCTNSWQKYTVSAFSTAILMLSRRWVFVHENLVVLLLYMDLPSPSSSHMTRVTECIAKYRPRDWDSEWTLIAVRLLALLLPFRLLSGSSLNTENDHLDWGCDIVFLGPSKQTFGYYNKGHKCFLQLYFQSLFSNFPILQCCIMVRQCADKSLQ
jgi:hypothetical protein